MSLDKVKANIEIYDWWSPRERVTLWRLGILLYHAINGGPELGPVLEDLLGQARVVLYKPNVSSFTWCSMAVGRSLILASAGKRNKIPRLYPATTPVPSNYLWRIFLREKGYYTLECYRVSYTSRRLDAMTMVDWHRAAKR